MVQSFGELLVRGPWIISDYFKADKDKVGPDSLDVSVGRVGHFNRGYDRQVGAPLLCLRSVGHLGLRGSRWWLSEVMSIGQIWGEPLLGLRLVGRLGLQGVDDVDKV